MENKEITIQLNEWDHTCGDKCCYTWGTEIVVNGEKLEEDGSDLQSSIRAILEHLGYKVNIEHGYDK